MKSLSSLLLLACLGSGCSLYNNKIPLDLGAVDGGDQGTPVDMQPDLPPMCSDDSVCPVALPVCGGGGQCGGCQLGSNTACATHHAATPLCGPSGACVECLSKDDCASKNQTCNLTTNACAACRAHADCSTGVCKPGGDCATAAEVAYVNNTNSATVTCSDSPHTSSRMSPYCQIQAAVTQTSVPPYVLVEGSATPYNPVSLNTTVKAIGPLTLIGPGRGATPGATLAGAGAVTPNGFTLLTGAGNAATVSLEGLTLIGAGGATPGAGARCTVGVGAATLSIVDSKIQMSGGAGVDSNGCTLTLDRNIISGNQGAGVSTNGGTLTLDRNIIGPSNTGGGVVLGGSTSYTVTNNIVWGNGGAAATTPGVQIANGASGSFAFNTVVQNTVSGAAGVGGIDCGSGGMKAIQFSIAWMNTKSGGTQIGAQCTLTNVVTAAGDDNRGTMNAMPPTFVSATDFHLVTTADAANDACCIDKVSNPSTPNASHDVDGAMRPKGAAHDIGAHEAR